jgi:hypothetical protein
MIIKFNPITWNIIKMHAHRRGIALPCTLVFSPENIWIEEKTKLQIPEYLQKSISDNFPGASKVFIGNGNISDETAL